MAKQGGRLGRGPIPVLAQPTGEEHPTPDSVPARKSSIIQGDRLSCLLVSNIGIVKYFQGPTQLEPPQDIPWDNLCQTLPWLDFCDQREYSGICLIEN